MVDDIEVSVSPSVAATRRVWFRKPSRHMDHIALKTTRIVDQSLGDILLITTAVGDQNGGGEVRGFLVWALISSRYEIADNPYR